MYIVVSVGLFVRRLLRLWCFVRFKMVFSMVVCWSGFIGVAVPFEGMLGGIIEDASPEVSVFPGVVPRDGSSDSSVRSGGASSVGSCPYESDSDEVGFFHRDPTSLEPRIARAYRFGRSVCCRSIGKRLGESRMVGESMHSVCGLNGADRAYSSDMS
jgi:hypothetical protein